MTYKTLKTTSEYAWNKLKKCCTCARPKILKTKKVSGCRWSILVRERNRQLTQRDQDLIKTSIFNVYLKSSLVFALKSKYTHFVLLLQDKNCLNSALKQCYCAILPFKKLFLPPFWLSWPTCFTKAMKAPWDITNTIFEISNEDKLGVLHQGTKVYT